MNSLRFVTSLFIGKRFEWHLPISIDETKERMTPFIRGNFLDHLLVREISASLRGNWFVFRYPSPGSGPVQCFYGSISRDAEQTRIVGYFRLPLFYLSFYLLWLSVTSVGTFALIFAVLRAAIVDHDFTRHLANLPSVLLPVFGVMVMRSSIRSTTDQIAIVQAMDEVFGKHLD